MDNEVKVNEMVEDVVVNGKVVFSKEEVLKLKEDYRKVDVVELEKKIRSISSMKCRYRKMENKLEEMERLVVEERIIREILNEGKEKKVVIYERRKDEIDCMSYEEVFKGIKNIDSILCIERSKEDKYKDENKIRKCDEVREWLVERRNVVSGNNLGLVKISDVLRKMEDVSSLDELKEWLESKVKKEENEE